MSAQKKLMEGIAGYDPMEVVPGDSVFFELTGINSKPVWRPGIVIQVWQPGYINGIAYLDGSNDSAYGGSSTQHTRWCTSHKHVSMRDVIEGQRWAVVDPTVDPIYMLVDDESGGDQ